MTRNTQLLMCSEDMHRFMEAHQINSIPELFELSLSNMVLMPDFPFRLLIEWMSLRDKFNLLFEN